jgi:hypothetical protein
MGESARPPGGYDKKTMAADIAALIRKLGHDRADRRRTRTSSASTAPATTWPKRCRTRY